MEIEKVKERVMEGRPGFTRQYGPQRADHQPGIPFWPQESYRDFVTILVLIAIIFLLAGFVTPQLGPPRSEQLSALIVPDWYLLFSWGLLQIADILPQFTLLPGTPLVTAFNAQFWGDLLSGIPVLFLLLLPFLDRGREARPAKAPVRSAVGIGFIIIWTFFASLYSIRSVVGQRWESPNGAAMIDINAMKWFFVIPPILVGLVTYIGLRRLGYKPMRKWLVPTTLASFLIVAVQSVLILFVPGWLGAEVRPYILLLGAFLLVLCAAAGAAALAVLVLPESRAIKVIHWAGILGILGFAALFVYGWTAQHVGLIWVESVLYPNMNTLLFLPGFTVAVGWFGLRRPYSTYEYLLNECYQCGKCHLACPITKVEDDALGGLNLVYNSFKKQHDGVPLWTCLACDACSAVCPLDIKYSDYILEERGKAHARAAADGGERT